MELDRKKTGIIIVIITAVIGVVVLLLALMSSKDEPVEQKTQNVYIEHPDADVSELSNSKIDAYAQGLSGRSQVENYWDSIEETEIKDEDPLGDLVGSDLSSGSIGGGSSNDLQKLKQMAEKHDEERRTEQEVRPTKPSNTTSTTSGTQARRKTSDEMYDEYMARQQNIANTVLEIYAQEEQHQQSSEQSTSESIEKEDLGTSERIEVEKPVIRRSDGISSLDGGFGSGISSLDGPVESVETDFSHPFKCMFVREEKIESGQRVSIRLLEDMIVGNMLIPKNTHLMAVCTLGARLNLKVTSIEMNGKIFSMNYEAYDNDGTKGIYCPDVETEVQDQAKRGGFSLGRRSATKMGSIASEIAGVGMTIAESVTSNTKKVVKVPQGYTFYLVNADKKQ